MKDLAAMLTRDGLGGVRTYIQSGNVVFQCSSGGARALEARIGRLILAKAGFEARVMVLSCAQLASAVRANPFPQADRDHKSLHLFFLSAPPSRPDLDSLRRLRSRGDAFALKGGVFYLYTPQGFPHSALHDKVERFLGVHATGRNWRTANQLLLMSGEGGRAPLSAPGGKPRRTSSAKRSQEAV